MNKYIELLKENGADRAVKIEAESIVTAPWTRYKCQFGCDFYGKCLTCPPYTPTWKETKEMIDVFSYGILFHLGENSPQSVTALAVEVSRQIFLDGYYKTIAFGSGPCGLCKTCSGETCRFHKKTLPSMEGCGIDVFQTVRNNGFSIKPLKERGELGDYFGLILVE